MQEIILFLLHSPGGTNFHYSTRHGRDLTFVLNPATGRHEVRIPLDEWRKENHFFARNILDQNLTVPILFDVTDIPTQAETPTPVLPVAEAQPIAEEDEDEAPRTTIIMRPRTGRKVNLNR